MKKGMPYDFDEFDNKVETYLDKNHSHFFLIKDDSEEKKFGGEIDFRADFEISLGTKENRKSNYNNNVYFWTWELKKI
jgi:hypothetical protein